MHHAKTAIILKKCDHMHIPFLGDINLSYQIKNWQTYLKVGQGERILGGGGAQNLQESQGTETLAPMVWCLTMIKNRPGMF